MVLLAGFIPPAYMVVGIVFKVLDLTTSGMLIWLIGETD
jgi:hypothetical protein